MRLVMHWIPETLLRSDIPDESSQLFPLLALHLSLILHESNNCDRQWAKCLRRALLQKLFHCISHEVQPVSHALEHEGYGKCKCLEVTVFCLARLSLRPFDAK
jgi:hypothetical protein